MAYPFVVFRLDRFFHQLRVQFRIQKGGYDSIVNELRRGEEHIQSMRDLLLGKWIKDSICDKETWLLVVAVEINTENVASTKKRYSSKKQEIFGAKVNTFSHVSVDFFSFFKFIITILLTGCCVCHLPSCSYQCITSWGRSIDRAESVRGAS